MAMKWFTSSKANLGSSKSLTAIDEPQALQDAMKSASLIMNDEVERAETELGKGTSPFHKLGRATALFLRATLGFEKEVMQQASDIIQEAESSASEYHKRAIRDPYTAHQSRIYPAGAEYALCHAEAQLMSAVIGVLNESLTESLRGFYKLRRAYSTLHEIIEAENKYMKKHLSDTKSSLDTAEAASDKPESTDGSGVMTPAEGGNKHKGDVKFHEPNGQDQGNPDYPEISELKLQELMKKRSNENAKVDESVSHRPDDAARFAQATGEDFDIKSITSDPVDIFIHSGIALCYGLLQLMLSMIPPTFSRILSILSFRGDRENGIRLLWRATAFKDNINGALAGLITLGFHNGAIALCDINSQVAYPQAKLRLLLQEMRMLYPKSVMWILEEARMASANQDLEHAIDILQTGSLKSTLKQVEAMRMFETSLDTLFVHHYEESANSWLKCIELNSWSHSLYYYVAGCCHVELFRIHRGTDVKKAEGHKLIAADLLNKAVAQTGKRRFMARQLPIDVFIARKIAKWSNRAKLRNCDLVEAIGVSPAEEIIYFWAGFKRMRSVDLEKSLQRLAWSEDLQFNPSWNDEAIDEHAVLALLKATCLARLGETGEARSMLTEKVFCYDLQQIKACDHADNWSIPVAHYENAVCYWREAGGQGGDKEMLTCCSDEILKVEKWESYDLDASLVMKVTTARVTLRKMGIGPA